MTKGKTQMHELRGNNKAYYIKGDYYAGLGTYIGTRKTHYPPQQNKSTINEHLFSTGEYDMNGAAILKRIKI